MAKDKETLHFWIPDNGGSFDDSDPFDVHMFGGKDDLEWAAEQYAEYYHDNRDGWESSWPILFSVSKPDGTFLGSISVDRESRTHFTGRIK